MKRKKNKNGYYRHREIYKGVNIDLCSRAEKELDNKVRMRKNDIDNGYSISDGNTRVSVWAEKWLEVYKKPSISSDNYGNYCTNVYNRILPAIGNMPIASVMPFQVQEILNREKGMSKSHIEHLKNALCGMFRQARINGLILRDPCEDLTVPTGTQGSHRALTAEETEIMFKVCDNGNRAAPLVYLMYHAGLRPQEVAALETSDIDLSKKTITVNKALDMHKGTVKETKTEAGNRIVPINNVLFNYLSNYLKNRNTVSAVTRDNGEALNGNALRAMWKALCRDMAIEMGAEVHRNQIKNSPLAEDFVPYNLRHTYCTNLQRAGVPINIAKYLMGHDDIKTTSKIYTHYTEDQAEIVLTMTNLFNAQTGTKTGT